MNAKSALHFSEDFRRLSEKNGSQIHYYTFQTELLDFCLKRMDIKYTITLFRLNLQISELFSCLLELQDECEVRFAFPKGNSKVV